MSKAKRSTSKAKPSTAMTVPVPQVLQPVQETTAQTIVGQLIQLARDPSVNVEKIGKLIEAQKEVMAIQAKLEFERAFATMQGKIPIINRDGYVTESITKSGATFGGTRFATLANINRICRPIWTEHGFSLRFENSIVDGKLKAKGILSHTAGHCAIDEFETLPDVGAGKNAIQSWGSARRYAQRYLTISLLNIAEENMDDDGVGTDRPSRQRESRDAEPAREYHSPSTSQEPITEKQRNRLYAIASTAKVSHKELKEYCAAWWGWTSSSQITRDKYDAICKSVEKGSPLKMPQANREPGEDG